MTFTDDYISALAMLLARHVDNLQRLAGNWSANVIDMFAKTDLEVSLLVEMIVRDAIEERNQSISDAGGIFSARRAMMLAEARERIMGLREKALYEILDYIKFQSELLVANEERFNREWLLLLFLHDDVADRSVTAQVDDEQQIKPLTEIVRQRILDFGAYSTVAIEDIYSKIFIADADRMNKIIADRVGNVIDSDSEMRLQIDGALKVAQRQLAVNTTMICNGLSNDTAIAVVDYNRDVVERLMWITEMDERVCADCEELEGIVFDLENVPACPLHPNCRCHLIPVTDELSDAVADAVEQSLE